MKLILIVISSQLNVITTKSLVIYWTIKEQTTESQLQDNYHFLPDIREIISNPSTTICGSILLIMTKCFTVITIPPSIRSFASNCFNSYSSIEKIFDSFFCCIF